jgi:hypothetical protein
VLFRLGLEQPVQRREHLYGRILLVHADEKVVWPQAVICLQADWQWRTRCHPLAGAGLRRQLSLLDLRWIQMADGWRGADPLMESRSGFQNPLR